MYLLPTGRAIYGLTQIEECLKSIIALLKCWQRDVVQTFLGKYEIAGQKQRMNSR